MSADESSSSRPPNRPLRPRGAMAGRRKRRVVIDSGAARPPQRLTGRGPAGSGGSGKGRDDAKPTGPVVVQSGVSVKDLSSALGIPAAQIIKIMLALGEMMTITQSLSDDAVQLVVGLFGPRR